MIVEALIAAIMAIPPVPQAGAYIEQSLNPPTQQAEVTESPQPIAQPEPTQSSTPTPVVSAEPQPEPAQRHTIPPILHRIAQCESGGDWTAQNPRSSASGKWQWIDSTWRSLDAAAGYSRAVHAPPAIQRAAALELYERSGVSPWAASRRCWR